MAKVKTFAVTVAWTTFHTVYVDARRPNGAAIKALTEEGWAEANRYSDDESVPRQPPVDARVVDTRAVT